MRRIAMNVIGDFQSSFSIIRALERASARARARTPAPALTPTRTHSIIFYIFICSSLDSDERNLSSRFFIFLVVFFFPFCTTAYTASALSLSCGWIERCVVLPPASLHFVLLFILRSYRASNSHIITLMLCKLRCIIPSRDLYMHECEHYGTFRF